MKTNLRKSFSHLGVTYKNGEYTNNLSGTDFSVTESSNELCFEVNLEGNYKVKNKDSNCYLDIKEFVELHNVLDFVQVDEPSILEGLSKAKKRNPNASWTLNLVIGDLGAFKYSVQPKVVSDSCFFNVENV